MFLSFRLPLLYGNLSGVRLVRLISYEHNNDIGTTFIANIINPFVDRKKRGTIGDIVDDDSDGGIANVRRDEGPKAFLSSGIPQLKTHGAILQIHGFGQEVDANSGLIIVVKLVVHEAGNNACLSTALIAEDDKFVLCKRGDGTSSGCLGSCHSDDLIQCSEEGCSSLPFSLPFCQYLNWPFVRSSLLGSGGDLDGMRRAMSRDGAT